jgi:hypothetical protein
MPKKILWVSQHQMQGVQMGALRRMFGNDVIFKSDVRPFGNAEDIVARVRQENCDDVIVVAPLSVLSRLVELGLRPLWAEARLCQPGENSDWEVKSRKYRFVEFKRVRKLVMEFDDLGPNAKRQDND